MRPFVPWAAAYIAGAAACSGLTANGRAPGSPRVLLIISLLLFCIAFVPAAVCGRKRAGNIAAITVGLLIPAFSVLGFARTGESFFGSELKSFLEKKTDAVIFGKVSSISVKEDSLSAVISGVSVEIGERHLNADGILVKIPLDDNVIPSVGDTVRVGGSLNPFDAATNPGQFDSEMYYRIRKVDARITCRSLTILEAASKWDLKGLCYRLRVKMSENIYKALPEREGSVLNSMLTGDRGLLDQELKDTYAEGGIAHILSISSLHISLLGLGLYRILLAVSGRRRLSVGVTLFIMVLYVILTGASVSSVRAVFMMSVMLIAGILGKGYDMINAAGFAALSLLIYQPLYIFDSGFRMSFLAVCGIFGASEVIRLWKIKNAIVKSLLISAGVQLMLIPVLMSSYFYLNPYSILINIVILPLMSVILGAGFAAAITGIVFIAGPVYFILRFYEAVCEFEKLLPYSRIITGASEKYAVAAYYLVLGGFCLLIVTHPFKKARQERSRTPKRNYMVTVVLLLTPVIFLRMPEKGLYAAFLDVGQGDAVYVEADGVRILSDAGSTSVSDVGKYRVIPFLMHRGVRRIDKVIASHMDKDHISAVEEMIEGGYPEIGELIVGENVEDAEELLVKARAAGIPVRHVSAGEVIVGSEMRLSGAGGLRIAAVAPETGKKYKDANEGSVVCEMTYGGFSMILSGDSGFESEGLYTERLCYDSYSMLKCPHHGSKYSGSEAVLREIKPVVTVISVSANNRYGHPTPETMGRLMEVGSEVYRTDRDGCVEVKAVKDKMIVRRYKKVVMLR